MLYALRNRVIRHTTKDFFFTSILSVFSEMLKNKKWSLLTFCRSALCHVKENASFIRMHALVICHSEFC